MKILLICGWNIPPLSQWIHIMLSPEAVLVSFISVDKRLAKYYQYNISLILFSMIKKTLPKKQKKSWILIFPLFFQVKI